jgi:hypothetical protein
LDGYKKVSIYIAKYCSKPPDTLLLDNVPYRNKTGRHAGWLRLKLIPMHPRTLINITGTALESFLFARASEMLSTYDGRYGKGFTVLFDLATEFAEDVGKFLLDNRAVPA